MFYIAGIIIGNITGFKGTAAVVLAVFSFSAAVAGYLLHWQKNRLLILVLFCLLGLVLSRFWIESSETALINYAGQRVVLKGCVVSEPDVREDKVFYLLQAQELVKAGETHLTPGLVRLQLQDCDTVFAYGDNLSISGLLIRPDPAGNPGMFDYRTYLERQGIRVILTARGNKAVSVIDTGKSNSLQSVVLAIKKKMSAAATYSLNPSQAAVLNGIVFGTQGLIDRNTKRSFSETGVIHILSVSGLHVGLVLGGLLGMLRLLKLPPVWTAPLATPVLMIYMLMTGMNPAVMRATIMALLFVWAHQLGRDQDWPTTLALAAMIILIWNPLQIYHPGFQLSFVATWGILYLGPFLTAAFLLFFKNLPHHAGRLAAQALAIPFAAQLATIPLVAWYYNLLSLVSIPANLLAVPLSGLIMFLGLAASFFGLFWLPLAAMVNVGTGIILDIFLAVVNIFQCLPGAVFYLSSPPIFLAAAWYGGLLAVARVCSGYCTIEIVCHFKRWVFVATSLGVALVLIWWPWKSDHLLKVHFIDVGQGDSILVQAPSGKNMLIDTGGRTNELTTGAGIGDQVLEPYLRKNGVQRIDVLILTHPHEDHCGGAVSLVKRFPVALALVSYLGEESVDEKYTSEDVAETIGAAISSREEGVAPAYSKLVSGMAARGIPVSAAAAGDVIKLDSDLKIEVLSPVEIKAGESESDTNNNSLVIKVTFDRRSFIFTGDAEIEEQRDLIREDYDLQADILKVPHHGSRFLLPELLEQVNAEAAVISVGARNTFGHPAYATLDMLSLSGLQVYRTDQDGAVIVQTDGNNLQISRGKESR
jgi:competence protein ComEC